MRTGLILLMAFLLWPAATFAQPFAYVSNYLDDSLSVIDTSANTVVQTIAVGAGPHGVAVTPNGARVYVTNTDDNSVSVIDALTNTVIATVTVVFSPRESRQVRRETEFTRRTWEMIRFR